MSNLVFVVVVIALWALFVFLMIRGWRARQNRQTDTVGELPAVPENLSAAVIPAVEGLYVGSTFVPSWQNRVAAAGLGYRAKATLTAHDNGALIVRRGMSPIWIPAESVTAIRTERGGAGKTMGTEGLLVIRWILPTGTEIDTSFRAQNKSTYDAWTQLNWMTLDRQISTTTTDQEGV